MLNFMEIEGREGCFYVHLLFGAKKKKSMKKIQRVSGTHISGTAKAIS